MPYKYSPLLDEGLECDPLALHLVASPVQTVTQKPTFSSGITANDDVVIKAGKKLILDGA